jgi:hypothetical protein
LALPISSFDIPLPSLSYFLQDAMSLVPSNNFWRILKQFQHPPRLLFQAYLILPVVVLFFVA